MRSFGDLLRWGGVGLLIGSDLSWVLPGAKLARCFMRMRLQFRQWKQIQTVLFLLFG